MNKLIINGLKRAAIVLYGLAQSFKSEETKAETMALVVAINEAIKASDWQPIETAPKGVKLIGFWEGMYSGPFIMWWNYADEGWEAMTHVGTEKSEPTHWMPLPENPPRKRG